MIANCCLNCEHSTTRQRSNPVQSSRTGSYTSYYIETFCTLNPEWLQVKPEHYCAQREPEIDRSEYNEVMSVLKRLEMSQWGYHYHGIYPNDTYHKYFRNNLGRKLDLKK